MQVLNTTEIDFNFPNGLTLRAKASRNFTQEEWKKLSGYPVVASWVSTGKLKVQKAKAPKPEAKPTPRSEATKGKDEK